MKRSRFTETQIISILSEVDAGLSVKEVSRKHGISDATYYNWKSKYGGMSANELKRLREVEEENAKPNQNAFIERFNKTYRVEVLNAYLFRSLDQVREITDGWLRIYNEERPHRSLGPIPPSQFRRQLENEQNSSYELSA